MIRRIRWVRKARVRWAVTAVGSAVAGKAGVQATGYKGIPIVSGKRYVLSFYVLSLTLPINQNSWMWHWPTPQVKSFLAMQCIFLPLISASLSTWIYCHGNDRQSRALFTSDTTIHFWLDVVSLFRKRPGAGKQWLYVLIWWIWSLRSPQFIRFPRRRLRWRIYSWHLSLFYDETMGTSRIRSSFWNIWSYGTTNGVGFLRYLRICEDLHADPIYVINSGVTNQNRRPRYEDITAMDQIAA